MEEGIKLQVQLCCWVESVRPPTHFLWGGGLFTFCVTVSLLHLLFLIRVSFRIFNDQFSDLQVLSVVVVKKINLDQLSKYS